MTASAGMIEVKKAARSLSWLATELGITRGAVSQWSRVPAERVLDVERATGVARHILRPDLYPVPRYRSSFASTSGHVISSASSNDGNNAAGATSCPVQSLGIGAQERAR